MTALVARQPLHPLPMSTTQRPTRRLSARLHDRNDALGSSTAAQFNGEAKTVGSTTGAVQIQTERGGHGKKRKIGRQSRPRVVEREPRTMQLT